MYILLYMPRSQNNIQNTIFAERLADLMHSRGFTQVMLAAGIGAAQPTISRYLAGQLPKAEELMKLARFFDVSMEVVVGAEPMRAAGDKGERRAQEAMRLQAAQPLFISFEIKAMQETAAKLRQAAADLQAIATGLEKHVNRALEHGRKSGSRRKRA
jgi:transcriptional regulator with XRE-family HTH domain